MYICTLNLQWNSPSKGYPMKLKQMTNWGWPFYVSLIMSLMVCKTFWNTNLPMQRSVNNRDVTTVLQVVVFLCIYIQQSNFMPPRRTDLLLNEVLHENTLNNFEPPLSWFVEMCLSTWLATTDAPLPLTLTKASSKNLSRSLWYNFSRLQV